MKNEFFNGQRFWTYFKYDLTQMWRNHMKAAIGIGLSGVILYLVSIVFSLVFFQTWQGPTLWLRIAIFGAAAFALELYQTRTYGYLTERRQGSAWLMTPASTFEKWLSMILMTLIVLPVLFFVSFLVTDTLIATFDPTVGDTIVKATMTGFSALFEELTRVNGDYQTTWTIWSMLPMTISSFCFNFLFFLLCGICFKKNKILGAFGIILIMALISSIITSTLAQNYYVQIEDMASAENYLRGVFSFATWFGVIGTIGLAGGIYYRLKTLKH